MFEGLVGLFRGSSGYTPYIKGGKFDSAGYYDYQRANIANTGFGQIFDVIGGIGSKLSASWQARDYADQMAEAQQRAYENARIVAAAQKESILRAAEFSAKLKEQNARLLMDNAYNLQQTAFQEKEQGFGFALKQAGDYSSTFAPAGVQLNTGSAKDVKTYIVDDAMFKSDNRYKERLNQIHETMNKAVSEKVSASFEIWNAKERGRFIDANTDLRLY